MEQLEIVNHEPPPLLDRPTNQLLNDFGAGRASPGSGSAAALLGILSSKMISTVCEISLRKEECSATHKEFEFISNTVKDDLEPRLKYLFELDAKDFDRVIELRKSRDNSSDTNEKSKLAKEAADLLETATDYTFEIADISIKLMGYGVFIFEHGWHAIRGDSGVAISAAMSGVMSSIFIANLNLKTLKKRKYAQSKIKEINQLQTQLSELQTKAFSCVTAISTESVNSIQLELTENEREI